MYLLYMVGIKKVWDVSRQLSFQSFGNNSVVLYFHSKGMWHNSNSAEEVRSFWEVRLFKSVIVPWKDVLRLFEKHTAINKVGYAAHEIGFMYHNFYWVRASYASRLEMPVLCKDRFYYENWLSSLCDDIDSILPNVELIETKEDCKTNMFRCGVWRYNQTDSLSLCLPNQPLGQTYPIDNIPFPPLETYSESLDSFLLQ